MFWLLFTSIQCLRYKFRISNLDVLRVAFYKNALFYYVNSRPAIFKNDNMENRRQQTCQCVCYQCVAEDRRPWRRDFDSSHTHTDESPSPLPSKEGRQKAMSRFHKTRNRRAYQEAAEIKKKIAQAAQMLQPGQLILIRTLRIIFEISIYVFIRLALGVCKFVL